VKFVVTTSFKASWEMRAAAQKIAAQLNAPWQERGAKSLADLKNEFQAEAILVIAQAKPVVHTETGPYFFHLSLAEMRIKNFLNGKNDHMIEAMALAPGMSVLDATLGLGTDAIVASYVTESEVVALESSPLIAFITGTGLKNFSPAPDELNISAALRRITVKNIDYLTYLKTLSNKSFDIVYFDPMFRQPVRKSSNLLPVRNISNTEPLSPDAVFEARRVARRRVVMKEANGSAEFARLGFQALSGGKYSSVQYGVIEV
jgi:hypothetical protein